MEENERKEKLQKLVNQSVISFNKTNTNSLHIVIHIAHFFNIIDPGRYVDVVLP